MKVACPSCGVLRNVGGKDVIDNHNERSHNGDEVARPVDSFSESDLPELKTIPTQYRDKWREEFEVYQPDTNDIPINYEGDQGLEDDSRDRCPMCDGRLKNKPTSFDIIECVDCGRSWRDVHVKGAGRQR